MDRLEGEVEEKRLLLVVSPANGGFPDFWIVGLSYYQNLII